MKSIYRFKVKDIAISTRKKIAPFGAFSFRRGGSGLYRIADQRLSKLPVGTTGCAPARRPLAFAEDEAGGLGGSGSGGCCGPACADCCALGCGGCCGLACADCCALGCGACIRASCLGSTFGAGLAAAVAVLAGAGFAAGG